MQVHPGPGVSLGKDYTLFATQAGIVVYKKNKYEKKVRSTLKISCLLSQESIYKVLATDSSRRSAPLIKQVAIILSASLYLLPCHTVLLSILRVSCVSKIFLPLLCCACFFQASAPYNRDWMYKSATADIALLLCRSRWWISKTMRSQRGAK